MKKQQIGQMAFLMDTAQFYNIKNRGVTPNSLHCSYIMGCAIGRHLPMRLRRKLDKLPIAGICNEEVFNMLPDKLKVLGRRFLSAVQLFHDNFTFWNDNGLTAEGEIRLKIIAQEILNGEFVTA